MDEVPTVAVPGPLPEFGSFELLGRRYVVIYWPRDQRKADLLRALRVRGEEEVKGRLRELYRRTHPDKGGRAVDFEQVRAVRELFRHATA